MSMGDTISSEHMLGKDKQINGAADHQRDQPSEAFLGETTSGTDDTR